MAYRTQIRLGVKAPPAAVWAALSDFDQWAEWNPYYVKAEGKMAIGAAIELVRELGGVKETIVGTLVDWVPGEQLVWRRTAGLFARTIAYIEIEGLTPTACILTVGEIFDGLIGQHVSKSRRRLLKAGMAALGEALKDRAEAQWDGVPDETVVPIPPVIINTKAKKPAGPMQMSVFGRRGPAK
jgi:hypothetical protein